MKLVSEDVYRKFTNPGFNNINPIPLDDLVSGYAYMEPYFSIKVRVFSQTLDTRWVIEDQVIQSIREKKYEINIITNVFNWLRKRIQR